MPKITRTKPGQKSDLRRFLDANKVETVVTGPVERYLLSREEKPRREDILHPSELCKNDLCDLAVYYRVIGAKPTSTETTKPSFQLQRIFDQGTEIHLKWQAYLTGAGLLEGNWQCPSTTCAHTFWAVSPMECPRCNHTGIAQPEQRTNMVYREVAFDAEDSHLIRGHADGKVGRRILEIKSMGVGTIRVEAPALLATHSYEVETEWGKKSIIDLDGLWKGIKRPFNVHQRQAHLYVALAKMQGIDVDGVVFLYEAKWNQSAKEFVVPYNAGIADPMLEKALDLKHAIAKRRPPSCPRGGCKECGRFEGITDYNEEHTDGERQKDAERGGRGSRVLGSGDAEAGAAGAGATDAAGDGDPPRTRLALGARRRTADGAVRPTDRVGRLPLGAARSR